MISVNSTPSFTVIGAIAVAIGANLGVIIPGFILIETITITMAAILPKL